MAVSVHLIGRDGFGSALWDDYVPWLDGLRLLAASDYELVDHLTYRRRISRAEAMRLIEGGKPLPWHEERAAELRRNIWAATTREVELRLEEW